MRDRGRERASARERESARVHLHVCMRGRSHPLALPVRMRRYKRTQVRSAVDGAAHLLDNDEAQLHGRRGARQPHAGSRSRREHPPQVPSAAPSSCLSYYLRDVTCLSVCVLWHACRPKRCGLPPQAAWHASGLPRDTRTCAHAPKRRLACRLSACPPACLMTHHAVCTTHPPTAYSPPTRARQPAERPSLSRHGGSFASTLKPAPARRCSS